MASEWNCAASRRQLEHTERELRRLQTYLGGYLQGVSNREERAVADTVAGEIAELRAAVRAFLDGTR